MRRSESGMALVLVVCLAMLAGVFSLGLFSASTLQARSARQYIRHEQAFYIAEAGVEAAASVIDAHELKSLPATGLPGLSAPVSFGGGSFRVTATSGPQDTIVISSAGSFGSSTRTIEVEMVIPVFDLIPPDIDAALGFYGSNHSLTLIGAFDRISGDDHELAANENCSGNNCWGDVSANPPAPASVYSETVMAIDANTLARIVAEPPNKVKTGDGLLTEADWNYSVDQLVPLADITVIDEVTYADNAQIGTRAQPMLVVVEPTGVLNFTGSANIFGMLILKEGAQLSMGGNAYFEGLVITFGSAADEISGAGTPKIVGAVVCLGENADVSLEGTGGIRYSSEALANLSNLNANTNRISLVSWREVK